MNDQSKAGMASTLAEGMKGLTSGLSNRDAVRLRKKQSDAELAKLDYREETGADKAEIDSLRAQNQKLTGEQVKRYSFDMLRSYDATGEVKFLNKMIKNPLAAHIYGDTITNISKVDPEQDAKLLSKLGASPEDFKGPEGEVFRNRFLKLTRPDGTQFISDINAVNQMTGYYNELSSKELEDSLTRSNIMKNLRTAEGKDTALVSNSEAVAAAKERVKEGIDTEADRQLIKGWDKELAGTTPGKGSIAQDKTKELVELFGGEEAFFNTDFGDAKNYRKAYPYISEIENLEGVKFEATDRKELADIKVLIAMGDPSKNITEAETGLYDSLFNKARKYLSDEVGGVAATSAYTAFRNSVRHALYGSALTEAEITSFNDAFGTLGQKLGPVLQQFKTSINQVKAKLESISRMKNPYSAKVRLGIDRDNIDDIISSLDQRLALLEGKKPGEQGKIGDKPALDEDKKSRIREIMRKKGVTK